jgi:hypothetical protein
MDNLYTTPEAARETGIPEGTIRSWLSRHPGVFEIGVHIILEESGRKMWTETGLQLLRSRATENAANDVAENDAATGIDDDILEPLLQAGEERLAIKFFQVLPERTLARIRRMLTNPTEEERELVHQSTQAAIAAGTHHLLNPETRRLNG